MNYCANCGKELKEGAKFCISCGTPQREDKKGETQETYVASSTPTSTVSRSNDSATMNLGSINIDKEKISTLSKGYFTYVKETLQHPTSSFTKESSSNGYIQFGLLALLEVMIIWLASTAFSSYSVFGFKEAIVSLIILTLFQFSSVAVVFGVQKFLLKSKETFGHVATQYGGFFSSVVLLHGIILLITLFAPDGDGEFLSLVVFLTVFFSVLAFIGYLLGSVNPTKIDSIYVVVIAYFVLMIVWFILFRVASPVVVDTLQNMMYKYLF